MTPRFNIGDRAFVASAGSVQRDRPCRVCDGQRWVTLILGTGEQVRLDCEYCSRGFEAPTGREPYYEYAAEPRSFVVHGVSVETGLDGEEVTYRDNPGNCWHNFNAKDCWPTAEEAMARSAELVAEHEAEQEAQMVRKKNDNKSYAWHAGYHLRNAKEHERQMEYHKRKAVIMKSLSKERVSA